MTTHSICTHTHKTASSLGTWTKVTHIPTHTHTIKDTHSTPVWHFVIIFTCGFTSTFTVIKAHIASALSSQAKWFVMICVDTGIVFPLRMGSLDSAAESLYIWWYLYFYRHCVSLKKQQILNTLEEIGGLCTLTLKMEHCMVWCHRYQLLFHDFVPLRSCNILHSMNKADYADRNTLIP